MRKIAAATIGVIALLVSACGGEDQPGDAAVYDRIAGLEDCAELQAEFNVASASHDRSPANSDESAAALGYMKAANERIQEVGC